MYVVLLHFLEDDDGHEPFRNRYNYRDVTLVNTTIYYHRDFLINAVVANTTVQTLNSVQRSVRLKFATVCLDLVRKKCEIYFVMRSILLQLI